jgi:hypothetical protein
MIDSNSRDMHSTHGLHVEHSGRDVHADHFGRDVPRQVLGTLLLSTPNVVSAYSKSGHCSLFEPRPKRVSAAFPQGRSNLAPNKMTGL